MADTVLKAADRGRTTLDLCAPPLNAAIAAFMLKHLPVRSLLALQGTCHVLKDMIDRAPPAILLAAFRTDRILPPAIGNNLNSIQSLRAALFRHAAVIRRLRSGACTWMRKHTLGADQVARDLSWSPSAQPHLAFAVRTNRQIDLVPDELHVLNTSTFELVPNAFDLPEAPEIVRLDWVSDRLLLCKVWDDEPATAVLDTRSGVNLPRLDGVTSLLSPDKRNVLVWHHTGGNAVYRLPAFQLRYHVALLSAATSASASMEANVAKWSMTGAHFAVCWKMLHLSQQPSCLCLMTVHKASDGSILHTFDIHNFFGSNLPTLSWSPTLESILLHCDGKCVVISHLDSCPELLGRYHQVGWSSCGRYIHGLEAFDQWANDVGDFPRCHIWDALSHEQVFAWRQCKGVIHAKKQCIVWAHDAPVCFIPCKQMVVLMPTFSNRLGGNPCRTLLLTDNGSTPLPAPHLGDAMALDWSLSACGRLLVNSGQGQRTSLGQLPGLLPTEAQVTVPSPLRQGAIQEESIFCTLSHVDGAPADRMGTGPNNLLAGHQCTTMAWHPTLANSRMSAACNHAWDVYLVDGCAARAVRVWYRDQLQSADMANPADVGPADLYWSPDGETLILSRQGGMIFLHFGPAD